MSASTAIGMVSTSLRNLLLSRMTLVPPVDVTVLGPDEPGSNRRINLFLYRIDENPYLATLPDGAAPGGAVVPTPLSLNLFYLLTVYAQDDAVLGNVTSHEILGEAMRVLRQNSPVPHDLLADGLADAREYLQVVHQTVDPEEISRIWTTFAQPYRLSVLYQVSTVQIDLLPDQPQLVPQRVQNVGTPKVQISLAPPIITEMSPPQGPAGTPVTLTGQNLIGQRLTVTVDDRTLLDVTASENTQSTTIPPDFGTGTYEVCVDVAAAFRRIFLFEVTS